MILTALQPEHLDNMLKTMDQALAEAESCPRSAHEAFGRIAATRALAPNLDANLYAGNQKAIDLAIQLGVPVLDADPADGFSWDGQAVATRTETAVFLHELAHWQIAPPDRRALPDFGLGAGPESGFKADADAACCVDAHTKELEENLASLLGILWETELGGPAIIAFCEQNWLELHDRPGTADHFVSVFKELRSRGLLTEEGRPAYPSHQTA